MFFDRLPGAGYVCAHRGARALAPENTMLAARRCLALGADFWEMDVQKAADGTLMVFHDDVLDRTTDVAHHAEFADRDPWSIHDFTREELARLDAGSWFVERDAYGSIKDGSVTQEDLRAMPDQRIPTLREVLEFTRRNDFPINIEIKDQTWAPGDLSIVGEVLDMIRETGATDLVLISSFNYDYIAQMHRLAPDIPLAALVEHEHPDNVVDYLVKLGAIGYHPDWKMLDAELVRTLTENGIRVSPYTVNDMDTAMSLIDAGCYSIITDYTHSLRDRLASRP